jgi:hypothetical protein
MKNLHRHLYDLIQTIRALENLAGAAFVLPVIERGRFSNASNPVICSPGLGAVATAWNWFVMLVGNFMRSMGRL